MKKRARKKHDEGWSPEDASTSIFRGPWFFRNSLSPRLRLLAARIAGGIENVDVSKERDWPVSRARGSPSLRSSPVSRVSSPTLQSRCTSLFFTLLSSHFVAQFHLVVSCQLNRKRRARGKNSGDGGATVGRKILCAESSFRLAITCLFFIGSRRCRRDENLSWMLRAWNTLLSLEVTEDTAFVYNWWNYCLVTTSLMSVYFRMLREYHSFKQYVSFERNLDRSRSFWNYWTPNPR